MTDRHSAPRAARTALLMLALFSLATAPARAHSPHDVVKRLGVAIGADGEEVIFAEVQFTASELFARSLDSGRTWTVTALPLDYRDMTAIAFSPRFAQDQTLALATNDAGLLFSQDRGDTWTQLTGGGLDPRVLDVAFSSSYAINDTLYAATPTGVYVSADDGQTWTPSSDGMLDPSALFVRTVPGSNARLFAGRRTVHRSDNGGATWIPLQTFDEDILSVAFSPSFLDDRTAVLALKNGGGVFATTNGGFSWSPMVDGLSDLNVNAVALGSDGTVFAVTHESASFRALVGQPFSLFDTGFEAKSNLTTNHYRHVALHPQWPDEPVAYVAGFEGLFRSGDGGASFRPCDVYSQKFNRQVVFGPGASQLFLMNYGGGLLVAPPSVVTQGVDATLGDAAQGGPGASGGLAPPAGQAHAPGGADGPGAAAQLSGPAPPHAPPRYETRTDGVISVFGQELVLSPQFASDQTMFYAQSTLHRSDNGGRTWASLSLPPDETVIRSLAITPQFPADQTLWLGTGLGGGVYRSPDAGQTWTQLQGGLPDDPQARVIMVSPEYGSDQTLYLSSRGGGMFKSLDGGDSWSERSVGLPGLKLLTSALSPGYPSHPVLLTGVAGHGIWRSADGGLTWEDANAGLPDVPLAVERFAFAPDVAQSGEVYVVILGAGVFHSVDAGQSWQPVGPGLPPDAPRTVAVSPRYADDRTLVVSTHAWVYMSRDAGQSWERLPGYTRLDDFDFLNLFSLAPPAPDQDAATRAPSLPADLAAWLAADACTGTEWATAAASDVGVTWPFQLWPTGAHGYGVSAGSLPGDRVEYDFRGDSVRWFAARGPDGGRARLLIDGQLEAVIELYSPEPRASAAVFERRFDAVGSHTIAIIVLGQTHPDSAGSFVRHDGFDVTY